MSDSAFTSLTSYIESAPIEANHAIARADAAEYGLTAPSPALGSLLGTLAAAGAGTATASGGAGAGATGAVAITPAAGIVGLHILHGLPEKSTLTCIDPEADHQNRAKAQFREAGYPVTRTRFLPSRPLDVLGRLAAQAYHVVYMDVEPVDMPAAIEAAWPLLSPGGTLIVVGSLLDGTIADPSRKDRDTLAAREADGVVEGFEGAVVTRLPLDAGVTLVTRKG
nr:Putative O-methyltransferase MSMEG_5073 [Streptococcus thermophilus]